MAIKSLQRRQTEVGRIRLGETKPTDKTDRNGNPIMRPAKLETFRFTSPSRELLERVAATYGGQVAEWHPQGGGATQWEVYTDATGLPVVVPPGAVSQWYEAWSGGVCTRRCDGERELLKDQPCPCDPDPAERVCKPTTRISLMMADIPGIGVWRLETHGFYAATELPAVAELLAAAGGYVQARLELQERSARREKPNKPGEYETRRWMVPVLHVDATPQDLLALSGSGSRTAIGAGDEQRQAIENAPLAGPFVDDEHVQTVLQLIPKARNREQLAQLWKEYGEIGAITDEVRAAFERRGKEINGASGDGSRTESASVQPEQPAAAEPVVEGQVVTEDREAIWMQVMAEASKHGWDLPTTEGKYREHMGHDPSEEAATANMLRGFLNSLKAGEVQ